MSLSVSKVNTFLMFKLPSAFLCGVRLKHLDAQEATVAVTFRWINQNPFGSMYFAVQMMAAELSTGALVMQAIKSAKADVSMLVAQNQAVFHKKAKGRIRFSCANGNEIAAAVNRAIATGEGQVCPLRSIGTDASGAVVTEMVFHWTVKSRGVSAPPEPR